MNTKINNIVAFVKENYKIILLLPPIIYIIGNFLTLVLQNFHVNQWVDFHFFYQGIIFCAIAISITVLFNNATNSYLIISFVNKLNNYSQRSKSLWIIFTLIIFPIIVGILILIDLIDIISIRNYINFVFTNYLNVFLILCIVFIILYPLFLNVTLQRNHNFSYHLKNISIALIIIFIYLSSQSSIIYSDFGGEIPRKIYMYFKQSEIITQLQNESIFHRSWISIISDKNNSNSEIVKSKKLIVHGYKSESILVSVEKDKDDKIIEIPQRIIIAMEWLDDE